ncbi:uncharacterized protein LOC125497585 isoform X2 [Beta vulgaris subsp. vulgaris]|uniref:uncharacterized protein LOC125497585 isoform X2 n=1 Tax=Beta vulgaris subsp. vulgaris TaxID=3555 RepID=UPI002036E112|nr:uncharacterized protein LOC125497585 isoform X2 [Beta vulgaris subsp. vulgaris]
MNKDRPSAPLDFFICNVEDCRPPVLFIIPLTFVESLRSAVFQRLPLQNKLNAMMGFGYVEHAKLVVSSNFQGSQNSRINMKPRDMSVYDFTEDDELTGTLQQ